MMPRLSCIRLVASAAFAVVAPLASRPAAAGTSPAPDVVLYCAPSLDRPMHAIAARYTAGSGVPVHIFVAPPYAMTGLLVHGARADLVAADAASLQAMATAHLVRADSIVALGTDPYVLVVGGAGRLPPAPLEQLIASHRIVLTDDTTAAEFAGAPILAQSVATGVHPATSGVADTATVIATTIDAPVLLGLVHLTEAHVPGISLAAVLPAPPTPFAAAPVTSGQSGHTADLLGFITGSAGRATLRAAGLDTPA